MRQHKIIAFSFALIVGLLLAIAPASASTVDVNFVGLGGASQNGVYTYPYYLTVNNGPWTPMMCDDFYDHISVGDSWQANITQLSSGDMSQTRFGDLTKYQEAAYLLLQTRVVDQSQWGNINWAVWDIFDPSADPGAAYQPGVDYWLTKAETVDLSKINFSGVWIVTPTGGYGQEFLYATPEPGTLLLIGSGLLGLWARRRRQA
ncbi:MAG: PEP-CTERM sorting domain-containing protein [Candidatus Korobacteraceae bacterium]